MSSVEFCYNNIYQASIINMAPFRGSLREEEPNPADVVKIGECSFFYLATILKARENMAKVRDNLKVAQS